VSLHEHLDDVFEAISPAPAPIEETMKRGTRIRRRRRATAVACTAAMVAVAICIPLTVHWQATSVPATSHYTVTVRPPGPHSPANEIAYGAVNGKAWRILMAKPTPSTNGSYGYCVEALGQAFDFETELPVGPCKPPSGATRADPVVFGGPGMYGLDPQAMGVAGAVAAEVTYVTVSLTNGTVLTLHPVTVYGSRYVAFAAPFGTTVKATAYSSRGEISSAVAFTGVYELAQFITWLRPGQHGVPRATGLLGSGTVDGKPWSATAYLGQWGICASVAETSGCRPASGPLGLSALVISMDARDGSPGVAIWTVPSSAARVAVTVHGEKTFQVRPVVVGVQKFVVFHFTGTDTEQSLTAYDSAGHVVGRSS
jgi:hypothetical protein